MASSVTFKPGERVYKFVQAASPPVVWVCVKLIDYTALNEAVGSGQLSGDDGAINGLFQAVETFTNLFSVDIDITATARDASGNEFQPVVTS